MIAPRIGSCLLAAALVLGACGGDDDDESSNVTVPAETSTTEPTTTTESTTTTTEDPKAAVEAAFYAQWNAFVEIVSKPDPANPLIDQHFAGAAKQGILDAVSRLAKEGFAARLPDDPSRFQPSVRSIEVLSAGVNAIAYECSIDGLVIYNVESGEVVDDESSEYQKANTFELIDGRWKLTSTRDLTEADPTCDA